MRPFVYERRFYATFTAKYAGSAHQKRLIEPVPDEYHYRYSRWYVVEGLLLRTILQGERLFFVFVYKLGFLLLFDLGQVLLA